jgi:hypothetical protein
MSALGLTALLLIAMGALGGVGYASSAVRGATLSVYDSFHRAVHGTPSRETSEWHPGNPRFSAAYKIEIAPKVWCRIAAGSDRRLRVSGSTTVPAGNIYISIEHEDRAHADGFPLTATLAVTSTSWGPTRPSRPGNSGRKYEASVTQKASGYIDVHGDCEIELEQPEATDGKDD